MLKIKGEKRKKGEFVDNLKELKAIVYGHHLEENVLIKTKYSDFIKIYQEAGKSAIIDLDVDGESYEVMIRDFQLDPVSDRFIHVDFYAITRGEEMEVEVPFEFMGESLAIKDKGAILNIVLSEIKVKTLPRNIPSEIKIDLSVLEEAGQSIRLEDVELPEGVSFVTEHLDEVIASVFEPKEEKEDQTTPEEVLAEDGALDNSEAEK